MSKSPAAVGAGGGAGPQEKRVMAESERSEAERKKEGMRLRQSATTVMWSPDSDGCEG